MADEKILFTVDASQIIVKLHFAGRQAIKGDVSEFNGFIVNTGIINDNPNGDPDNIGKTKFDLKNQNGLYCAGVVRDFDFTMSFKLKNALTDIFKLRAKLYGNSKKLLDPAGDLDEKTKFDELVDSVKKAFAKASSSVPANADFTTEDGLRKIQKDARNLQNDVQVEYEKTLKAAKKKTAEILDKYMKVFAGADNTEDISSKNINAVQVSNSFTDVKQASNFIKEFDIVPISDVEREETEKRFQSEAVNSKDPDGNVECKIRMCFYVIYSLKIEDQ